MTQTPVTFPLELQGAVGTGPARGSSHVETAPVVAQAPVPPGGGRIVIDKDGNGRTTITSMAMPPEVMPLARMAQETVLGFVGLLAAIFLLGPFARMIARRMEKRPELKAAAEHTAVLQQQLRQLQESVDTMSVEMERISESQRFQSKLLYERKGESAGPV